MIRISYLTVLLFLLFFNVHGQEEIIVKFSYSYLDYEFVDNKNRNETTFAELFNEKAKQELHLLNSKFP